MNKGTGLKYRKKPLVLIVDDDRQVLKSLRIWLKNEGFRSVTAANGNQAVKLLMENVVDVALVDYRLRKENGIDVTRRLKDADEKLKIIIMTGFPSFETAVQAMKTGVFDYISKGSSNEKILEVIVRALEEREREKAQRDQELLGVDVLRLVLFCYHSLLKERLENYSAKNRGFQLVKSFSSIDSVQVQTFSQQIDIALICAGCMVKSIQEAHPFFNKLYQAFPKVKPVLINESFSDQEKVDLLKLGVKGFSSKDLSSEQLEKALARVKRGEIWVSRSVITLSLQDIATYRSPPISPKTENRYGLSERELDILKTMVLGLKNKEIAKRLFISDATVKTHVNKIFKKLGVKTRAAAILTAVNEQLI
jgi:DNA-binding NarL/FixJ family response regulator